MEGSNTLAGVPFLVLLVVAFLANGSDGSHTPDTKTLQKQLGKRGYGIQPWRWTWKKIRWWQRTNAQTRQVGALSPIQNNQRYIMYHGTSCARAKQIRAQGFKPSPSGMLGSCVYMSRDITKTFHYARTRGRQDGDLGCIVKASADVGKVIQITQKGQLMQQIWMLYGYDSAWVPPNSLTLAPSGKEESCIKDPARITVLAECTISQGRNGNC